jgi:hypothetical protein
VGNEGSRGRPDWKAIDAANRELMRKQHEELKRAVVAFPEYTRRAAGWTTEQRVAAMETLAGLAAMLQTISEDPDPALGGQPLVQATVLGVLDTVQMMQVVVRG